MATLGEFACVYDTDINKWILDNRNVEIDFERIAYIFLYDFVENTLTIIIILDSVIFD